MLSPNDGLIRKGGGMNYFFKEFIFQLPVRRPFLKWITCGIILASMGGPSLLKAQMPMLPTIKAEFRTDAEWKDNDDPEDLNLSRATLRFIIKRAHLNLEGQMDDQVGYRLRVRWNQSFAPQDDNTGMGLEYWYVKYQWLESLQLRVGKQKILQGGREGVHNPIDVFEYSSLGERIRDFYEVGVSAIYDLGLFAQMLQDQSIVGQVFNQRTGSSDNQFGMIYNLAWYGVFAGGIIEPVFQYGFFPHAQENEKEATSGKRITTQESYSETFLSLGALINLESFWVEMDLINHHQASYTERMAATTIKHHTADNTSVVLSSGVEGEQFSPFSKWIYDLAIQNKSSGTIDDNRNEILFGTSYFPNSMNRHLRWHALFAYKTIAGDTNQYSEYRVNGGLSARF